MTNWKTTLTGTLAAVTSALTVLAALPAQLGDISTIIPEKYKSTIVAAGMVATVILRVLKSVNTADAAPAPIVDGIPVGGIPVPQAIIPSPTPPKINL